MLMPCQWFRRPRHLVAVAATAGLLVLSLGGCLEREETLKVQEDGTVEVTITLTADSPQELDSAPAPEARDGWSVRQSLKGEGQKAKHVLTASRRFAPGDTLPSCDAPPGADDAHLHLQFPTDVRIEKRADGTYYHFRRVFEARPSAWWNRVEDRGAYERLADRVGQKDKPLSAQEWSDAVRELLQVQVGRKLTVARRAVLEAAPEFPQDRWLKAYGQVVRMGRDAETSELVAILQRPESPERNTAVSEVAQEWEDRVEAAIRKALAAEGLDQIQLSAFDKARARINRQNQITSQVEGESFVVHVAFPGRPVGSNADEQSDGVHTWRFRGNRLMDRNYELLATARVPAAAAARARP